MVQDSNLFNKIDTKEVSAIDLMLAEFHNSANSGNIGLPRKSLFVCFSPGENQGLE